MANCVFCKIVAGEIPADKLYEDNCVLAFLDIAPINKGHTLVVPREHFFGITAVPAEIQARMMQVGARLGAALLRAVGADGFNLILSNGACAGQVVQHVHLHVIPRFPDDGISLPARSVPYEDDNEKREIIDRIRNRMAPHA
ncbi:MAG: HIT family protein [Kiritimatiellaeota bacterium]|nr:HIT family protein [Kiritimatiellota bacterium]